MSHEAQQVHDGALIVDLHCDMLLTSYFLRWNWSRRHGPHRALMGQCDLPRLKEGNLGCLALGIVINPLRGASGPDAIRGDLDRMDAELARAEGALALAPSTQQIAAAREQGRIAVFAGLEGAHGLAGSLDDLAEFKARGLGYVGLSHFSRNEACRPMVGWGADATTGLSPYGQDLVDELNRLQIVVDVAHVNRAGVDEVCSRTKAPVICSHTACNAVHKSPRGLDDDQIRTIADTGGVVGVIFATPFIGAGGVGAVAAHMDHIKRLVGVQHCAVGTDWEGWTIYPSDLDSADKMPLLTEALLERGWSGDDVLAAYGGNFMRVLGEVAKG